jgi:hypothetical protein
LGWIRSVTGKLPPSLRRNISPAFTEGSFQMGRKARDSLGDIASSVMAQLAVWIPSSEPPTIPTKNFTRLEAALMNESGACF